MKLLIVIVSRGDARGLDDALSDAGYSYTQVASTGGFLRAGNVTLLIGVPEQQVDAVLQLVGERCHPREQAVNVALPDTRLFTNPVGEAMAVTVGGAHVFVLDVEQVVRI